jgi:hypothetical protein
VFYVNALVVTNSLLGQQKPVIGAADHIAIDEQCQFFEISISLGTTGFTQ